MITNQITNSTIERQTLSWGKSINNNLLRSQIRSNTLKLKITGLTPNSEYFWVIKNEPNQLNDEARNTGVFIQGEIKLTESQLSGTIDGSNTVFTVPSTDFLNFGKVYKNGLEDTDLLIEGTDYTVSSNQITFTVAPTVTDTLQVSYIVNTTEANIDVPLVDTKYSVGSTYYFGVREDENDEGIRVTFKISQNTVLATGTDIIDTLPGGIITYSGFGINSSNNKILDEKSLSLTNITTFDNTKIPTNLAVQTFVNNQIASDSALNLKIAENLNDLQDKATARTNLDVYSTTQVNNSLALKQDILGEGAFVDGDKDKLDGIENGATADQTATEIKSLYESNSNTNAYTDTEKSKVANVPANTNTELNSKFDKNGGQINEQTFLTKAVSNANFPALILNNFVAGATATNACVSLTNLITQAGYPYSLGDNSIGSNLLTKRFSGISSEFIIQINNSSLDWQDVARFRINEVLITGKVKQTLAPADADDLTRKDYVDGLDNENAKLTQNNTFTGDNAFTGDNTFDNPINGANPTADNHLTTRSWADPTGVVEQVNIIKNRFLAESLTINNWKLAKLEQLYKDILVASEQDNLPNFLLIPNLSADLSSPTSTKLINLGTETDSATIVNTTVGNLVDDKNFDIRTAGVDVYVDTSFPVGEEDSTFYYQFINNTATASDGYVFGNSTVGANSTPRHSSSTLRSARYDLSIVGVYPYTTSTSQKSIITQKYDASSTVLSMYQDDTEILNPSTATLDGNGRALKATAYNSGNIKLFNTFANAESFNGKISFLCYYRANHSNDLSTKIYNCINNNF